MGKTMGRLVVDEVAGKATVDEVDGKAAVDVVSPRDRSESFLYKLFIAMYLAVVVCNSFRDGYLSSNSEEDVMLLLAANTSAVRILPSLFADTSFDGPRTVI
jgi:hypothetical protein